MALLDLYEWALTREEARRLDALAERRNDHWVKRGVRTKKMGPDRGDVEIHRMGCYGEYACCMLLGIPFNWADDHPDDDIDGTFEGKTVQIKATVFGNRLLLFTNMEHFKADLAILALVDLEARFVRMVGWVTHDEYEDWHKFDRVLPHLPKQPQLDRSRLHSPETLVPHPVSRGIQGSTVSFTDHLDRDDPISLPEVRAARLHARALAREKQEAERRAQLVEEDRRKRAYIQAGLETRQPPEYRGTVWDVGTRDGVRPTAFPPLRDAPQEGLSDAFIAFQAHNQTRYETHPNYYCVQCKIRYNARDGGRCGPCIGRDQPAQDRRGRPLLPPEYPT